MRLDTQYIARIEQARRDAQAGIAVFGYAGSNGLTDSDFRNELTRLGLTYDERAIPGVGTWAGNVRELHYVHPEHGPRFAYILLSQEIDSSHQDVYIFGEQVPDTAVADTIEMIRRQERGLAEQRRQEIDRDYPPYWRMINHSAACARLAWRLRQEGWTDQVAAALYSWGAYGRSVHDSGITGLGNPFAQSLLRYADLIAALPEPDSYIASLGGR